MKIKFEIEIEINEENLNENYFDGILTECDEILTNLENEGVIKEMKVNKSEWNYIK